MQSSRQIGREERLLTVCPPEDTVMPHPLDVCFQRNGGGGLPNMRTATSFGGVPVSSCSGHGSRRRPGNRQPTVGVWRSGDPKLASEKPCLMRRNCGQMHLTSNCRWFLARRLASRIAPHASISTSSIDSPCFTRPRSSSVLFLSCSSDSPLYSASTADI